MNFYYAKNFSNESDLTVNIATTFLDKLPLNFLWIGFIKIIYPKSKIIHCVRNLEDICLSNYKNVFEGDVLKWTYNLDELLVFVKLYLDFLEAIKGYSNKRLPKTFLVFLPGNPLLPTLPIINAKIIFLINIF